MINKEKTKKIDDMKYLSSIPGMVESIIEGKNTKPEECIEIDWEKMVE